jgi:L-threonylcarbamoyladenylate synthase
MARCYRLEAMNATKADIARTAQILIEGGLVAFPTETVYGLGADATNDRAVARIFEAKGRPRFNPLIAHIANAAEARVLGRFEARAERLAEAFWPGPLTLVLPRGDNCPVSRLACAGLDSIALRVPQHPVATHLLEAVGRPVVAPSANPSGRLSPTEAAHVAAGLGAKVDMILDGGPCGIGLESTIVSLIDDKARLLRSGGLPRQAIERVLGETLAEPRQHAIIAPGQLASHYAPRARLRLNAREPRPGEVFIGFGAIEHGPHTLSATGDLIEAAANLFAKLHELDAACVAAIAIAPIPNSGLGEAINDRLARAAADAEIPA